MVINCVVQAQNCMHVNQQALNNPKMMLRPKEKGWGKLEGEGNEMNDSKKM